jgi:plastocyanin
VTARRPLVAVLLLVATVLAACGKDGDAPALSGDPAEAPATTTTTAAAEDDEPAAAATTIELTGAEYVYAAGVPTEPVPAGEVTVTFENIGREEHQASIVRFKDGKALPDLVAVGDDPRQLATVVDGYGGPNGAAPGATTSSTQVLDPGEYLFICFIPTPDGQPHATQGMLAPFTVTGEVGEVEEIENELVVLDEYTFGEPGADSYSSSTFGFVNDGEQIHEAVVYELASGATFDDAVAWFAEPADAEAPVTIVGGIGPLSPGLSSMVSLDLEPGDYVFACFIPDAADGAPHVVKGMVEPVTIE